MATYSISDFRRDVRDILGDAGADRRHTDESIDLAVVDGVIHMRAVRPDSRYVNGVLKDYDFPSAPSELESFVFDMDPRWRTGVVYYAAARRYEADVVDAVNRELAAAFFKQADAVFAS